MGLWESYAISPKLWRQERTTKVFRAGILPVSQVYGPRSFPPFVLQSTSPQTTGISHIFSTLHTTSRVERHCHPLFYASVYFANTECLQNHTRSRLWLSPWISVVVKMWALGSDQIGVQTLIVLPFAHPPKSYTVSWIFLRQSKHTDPFSSFARNGLPLTHIPLSLPLSAEISPYESSPPCFTKTHIKN